MAGNKYKHKLCCLFISWDSKHFLQEAGRAGLGGWILDDILIIDTLVAHYAWTLHIVFAVGNIN